jgi:hypothetical protein
MRKAAARRAAGIASLEGDVEWTSRSTLLYPALCSFAGMAAGVFGVGGGIIKGPLMLEMGVLPEVAAATSATVRGRHTRRLAAAAFPAQAGGAGISDPPVLSLLRVGMGSGRAARERGSQAAAAPGR